VISTCHTPDSRELDWLMVHPNFHGTPVSRVLMEAGMDWLGRDRPMWLNVLQHNARAIRFYERFGFAIDPDARTAHLVPHFIMRRPAA
jgi:GNAT superfamily N-acetyltransferase